MTCGTACDHDVAIVGYGPTGAVLANLLGAYGWRIALFDREPDLLNLPRAVHFDAEVMRIFDAAGLAGPLLPKVRPSGGMRYLNVAGALMLERKAATAAGPHGWANNYLFHQPDLERVLREGVARYPAVHSFLRHEVEAVTQDAAGATLQVRDLDRDAVRSLRARWVVGCDGARSRVREALGARHLDLGLHQSWLVVDVLLERPLDLPEATTQFCDPARPMTFVNVTGRRRRWEIMLMPGDDPQAMTQPDNLWKLLARWIRPGDAQLVRHAIYTFHALLADRWRTGRLLLAGDSAHQTPPFLGQGMCAGIRDAANLAWKLDRVLRGADHSLLDTYQSERSPHVEEYIRTAVRLGNIIQTTDPAVAAERDRQFAQGGPQEIVNLSPPLGPGCHAQQGAAGSLPGQPRLSDGRLLDTALGAPAFAVLAADAALLETLRQAHQAALAPFGVRWLADPALADWLQPLGAPILLLRPDRYVYGSAQGAEDFAAQVRTLAQALDAGAGTAASLAPTPHPAAAPEPTNPPAPSAAAPAGP